MKFFFLNKYLYFLNNYPVFDNDNYKNLKTDIIKS